MSVRPCPDGGRVSLRCGRLLLLTALLLGGTARPGAAQGPAAVSFRPPITYDRPVPVGLERVGGSPLVTADLDGDGRLDLVVITKDGLSILYGNGDGTFAPPVDYALGPGLQEGVVADVNGDGLPDLVFCHFDLGKVVVLLNQGGRRFASPIFYPASDGPVSITAADFNGDGKPDLAVSCHLAGNLVVLLNRGDGTFLPPVVYGGIGFPGDVISGDFNGDGKIDLAQASLTENNVRILLGDGTGKFTEKGRYGTDFSYAARGVTADFNGDGILDLAIGCQDGISILFGDGKGGFGPAIHYHGFWELRIGDFDGDGVPDLVAAGYPDAGFSVYLNRQAGNFLSPLTIPGPGATTRALVVGDFNGDGRPDVVTWNDSSPYLAVFLNNTPGPPAAPPPSPALTLFPNPVPGGLLALGQVTLSQPAASGGAIITLTSSNPAAAVVPAAVTVLPGASSVTFPIVTFPVAAPAAVLISASSSFGSATAKLQVLPLGPEPPPAPPGLPAPTNLSAQLLIEARVQLAWTPHSTDEDGFAIWRQTPTRDWTQVGVAPPHATTFLDPGVSPSTAYRYRVRATRGSLTSDWSNEAALTTPAAPSAPTGLRVELLGTTLVSLTWSADSSNATAMTVFRQTAGGDWTLVGERQPYVRQFTDRGLIPNTRYSYRVVAHNNEFVSGGSNEVSVMTLGP